MKFRIEFPKTIDQYLDLDKKKGDTFWDDAIAKETKNVQVVFSIQEKGYSLPLGHQFIKCHMIFDVNMKDLRQKARMVASGHITDTPKTITCLALCTVRQ